MHWLKSQETSAELAKQQMQTFERRLPRSAIIDVMLSRQKRNGLSSAEVPPLIVVQLAGIMYSPTSVSGALRRIVPSAENSTPRLLPSEISYKIFIIKNVTFYYSINHFFIKSLFT